MTIKFTDEDLTNWNLTFNLVLMANNKKRGNDYTFINLPIEWIMYIRN